MSRYPDLCFTKVTMEVAERRRQFSGKKWILVGEGFLLGTGDRTHPIRRREREGKKCKYLECGKKIFCNYVCRLNWVEQNNDLVCGTAYSLFI